MYRKIIFFFICIYGSNITLQAQVNTNARVLSEAALGYKLSFNQHYAKALTLAKSKGWALSMSRPNGTMAILVGVDPFGFPLYYASTNNTIAAATTRANQLWPGGTSGLNLTGGSANMKNKIAVWDEDAVRGTHVELAGRVTQKDNATAPDDHATHVSGTMIASGVNPAAKGMAYGAQGLIAYSFKEDIAEIFTEAPNLLLSNHSYAILAGWVKNSDENNRWEYWGRPAENEDFKFGYYSDDSQALDSIAYNAPYYLIVKAAGNSRSQNGPAIGEPYFRPNAAGTMASAGNRPSGISSNDGYDIISWDCGAKNILTVGAVNGLPNGYSRKEDVSMSAFSSWGPTDDGRIKPDIVADGVSVLSSSAASNTSYASFSGTSMASPNTTGSLFLLQEYYSKLKSGNFLRSATLKGLAIHTADEAGTTPGPDYQFGWGLLNVEKAAAVITAAVPSSNASSSTHQLYENVLTNGQNFSITVVASGKGPLQATICWTDVKGVPVPGTGVLNNRTKMLVNDLDIRITKGSGPSLRTYMPWTLDVNNPSLAAVPGDNVTDNVERIDIDTTLPGQTYTITITHKGTLVKGSQAYSLLVSGVGGSAYCTSASGGGGARIDSVSFKNVHVSNPSGSRTYTDYTTNVADIEAAQTIPIAVKVSTADATTNGRIVKIFIDLNNNGVFDSGELLATSGVLTAASQLYTTNLTIPNGLTVGNISLMRIVVQETANEADVSACGTYGKGETQDYRVRVVSPSNDVSISEITSPTGGSCANGSGYLTIKIRNNGSVSQTGIPVTATVTGPGGVIANLAGTYPGTIAALSTVTYTFQTAFATTAGTAYSISVVANLAGDQNLVNNQLASSFSIAAKPSSPSASGEVCNTTGMMKVNNPELSNYFWYVNPTTNIPFAAGNTASISTVPADKTVYVAKEAKTSVGLANKLVYPQGGYNTFAGNYVKINNTVPLVIESVRLYIGNPGQVRITLANIVSEDASGSYSYSGLASTTIDVFATNPTPGPGAVTGNPTTDTGAVYVINLPVSTTGDHVLILECLKGTGRTDSASVFRNNGITGTATYPVSIPGIMSITGNSAHTGTSQESQFYYFFYDMRISTGGCVSDRVPVLLATPAAPVITQQGDSLVSSGTTGMQWYYNDTALNVGVNHYKPVKMGRYKVIVTDSFNCQQTSNVINFTVTAIADVQAAEIKLQVSPNPNNGAFNLSFEVSTRADLTIDLLDAAGRKVYTNAQPGFTGKYSKQLSVPGLGAGMYLLRIQHDKKTYIRKILVQL